MPSSSATRASVWLIAQDAVAAMTPCSPHLLIVDKASSRYVALREDCHSLENVILLGMSSSLSSCPSLSVKVVVSLRELSVSLVQMALQQRLQSCRLTAAWK